MVKFAIPKTITFESLGDEFKDSWLKFRSIPVEDITKVDKLSVGIDNDPEKSIKVLDEILGDYFMAGSFYDVDTKSQLDVSRDDLTKFSAEVLYACFTALKGVANDPKDVTPSTT